MENDELRNYTNISTQTKKPRALLCFFLLRFDPKLGIGLLKTFFCLENVTIVYVFV